MLDIFAAARLEVAREFEAARLSLLEPDGHIRGAARRPKNENSLQELPHEIIEAQTELPCQQPGKQALGALSSCLRAVGKVRALNCLQSGSSSSQKPRKVVTLGLSGAGDSSLCSSRSSIVSCQTPTPIPSLAHGLSQSLTQSLPPILRQDTTHRVLRAPSVPSSPQPMSQKLPEEKRKKNGAEVGAARRIDDSPSPSPKLPAVFKRTDFVLVQQPVLTAAVTGASAERIRKGYKPMPSPGPRSLSSESDIGLSMASGISLASGVSQASTLNDDDPEGRAARTMSKLQRAVHRTQQVRALATAAARSSQKRASSESISPSPRAFPKGIKDILSAPAIPNHRRDSKGCKEITPGSPSSSPPNHENGIKALASMLASKCGDLESAFAHFANNRSTISRLRWETCLSNMHLDTQAFFGMPAGRVFNLAAKDQTSIDKFTWFQFFEPNRAPLVLDLPGQLNSEHSRDGTRTPELLRRRRRRGVDITVEDIEGSDEDNSRPSSVASSSDSSCEEADIAQKVNDVKHIRDALSRKSNEELDEEEIKLLDEIKEMGLKGVEAFAHVLKSKLGTLKRAFWFFDTNQRSRICKVQWETCLLVLHIDLQKLCGLRKDQVFAVMDEKTRGVISKKDWKTFFETTNDVVFEKKLQRKQAKKRTKKARRRAEGQTQEEWSVEDLDLEEEQSEQGDSANDESQNVSGYSTSESSSDHQEAPRKTVRRKKQRKHVEPAQPVKEAREERDDTTKGEPKSRTKKASYNAEAQPPSLRTRQRSDQVDNQEPRVITKRLSTDFENQDNQDQEDEDFRAKVYKELSSLPEGTCKAYMVDAFTARQRDIVKKVAKQLRLWTHVEDTPEATYEFRMGSDDVSTELRVTGGSIVVGNVSAFAQDALRKIRSIPKGGVHQFLASCTETQRSVVQILARGQGLWSCCEGTGKDRHVVVFNHREHVEEMRKLMGFLKPKESLKLPGSFSAVERRIALNIAAEMGYWSHTADKSCVEVFNVGNFPQVIEDQLRGLPPGAARDFSGPLHENELRVISFVADKLGFASETFPDGAGVGMRVANMQEFTQKIQNELEALQPGDSKRYENPDRMEGDKIQEVATNLALQVTRSRDGMTVKRPAAEVLRSDEEPAESESGGVELERVAEVFDNYATGYSNGEKVFLRFPDLRKFAQDMQDIHPARKHQALMRLLGPLEGVFDDTLQLQIDIRHGTRRGLTLRYFHVFLQKASSVAGWSIMRLLFGLLEEESRRCGS